MKVGDEEFDQMSKAIEYQKYGTDLKRFFVKTRLGTEEGQGQDEKKISKSLFKVWWMSLSLGDKENVQQRCRREKKPREVDMSFSAMSLLKTLPSK